jgi:peptidoglycan/xylan/chitin deacetylase (PgdA/CDA1 family)
METTVPRRVAVLAYHKIGPFPVNGWDTWFYIPQEVFVRQLEWLKADGWSVLSMDTFLAGLADPATLPDKAALITFDDGYQSMRRTVAPVLTAFGYPAVVFVPTDFIGGRNTFDHDNEPDEPMCNWEDLRDLLQSGIAVQAHGVSHRAFSKLSNEEQVHELARSKSQLETVLGTAVTTFAYPYGDGGSDHESVAQACRTAGYRAAFLYTGGILTLPVTSPFHLSRVPMGPDTDLETILQ